MFTRKHRGFGALVACTLAALLTAAGALADGDPASDVLLSQNVFFGYSPPSQKLENELYSVTAAAQRSGYRLRIALIDSRADLGAVPQYFGRPQVYARYLSYELSDVAPGQFLVVMPNGFGHAVDYRELTLAPLAGIRIGPDSDGLGTAAVNAAEKLAAAAGHPLGTEAADQTVTGGASGASITRDFDILLVLFVLTAMALAGAVRARRRRERAGA